MKYQCIVPILVGYQRIRVDDIVEDDIAKQAGEHIDKYFVPVSKVKSQAAEQPMTVSDIVKARQYNPPKGRAKAKE